MLKCSIPDNAIGHPGYHALPSKIRARPDATTPQKYAGLMQTVGHKTKNAKGRVGNGATPTFFRNYSRWCAPYGHDIAPGFRAKFR
jgi:hypothetical protein